MTERRPPTLTVDEPQADGRRDKLYGYDAVAAQALNPHGASAFTETGTAEVWAGAARGSKNEKFHMELASLEPWRAGVGTIQPLKLLESLEQPPPGVHVLK